MRSKAVAARWVLACACAMVAVAGPASPAAAAAADPPTPGALYADGQSGRFLLGGTWLFRADPLDRGVRAGLWRDEPSAAGWSPVTVPSSFNAGDYSTASMLGSVGWYRREFVLPSGAFSSYVPPGGRAWIVRFESVNYRASVWLNGRLIGTHEGAYQPFELDLRALRPGVNRLVVRVDSRRGPADLPPGPSGGWWNFGGILREVYLRSVQNADLSQVMVRPLLPCRSCAARIVEQVQVRNLTNRAQSVRLHGFFGPVPVRFGRQLIPPHGLWLARAVARLARPRLWAPGSPFLYRASLRLEDSRGRRLGGYFTWSGIRSIRVVGGHLQLNGRWLNLRGVALHEQDLQLGGPLDAAHQRQLVEWAREVGAGIIRAHYPLSPLISELADRYGILVWNEIPVYQLSSQYLARGAGLQRALTLLRRDIVVNQDHPSVLLWSIGNELASPPDAVEAKYIAAAARLAHTLDPTRPVGMAGVGPPCSDAYNPLDVLGDNEYFGWFDALGGGTDDRDALSAFLDQFRACWPTKALMITEFGFDANRPGPVEERGTYAFQSDALAYHLRVFAGKRWLSGAIYFALQDFAAKPGWSGGNPRGAPPFVQKGPVCGTLPGLCPGVVGLLKPSFGVMGSLYRATAQIAPAR